MNTFPTHKEVKKIRNKLHTNQCIALSIPKSRISHLTDRQWGSPFLSGRGRLVIKDIVIPGAALIMMSESAQITRAGINILIPENHQLNYIKICFSD